MIDNFCGKCGFELLSGSRFCTNCGNSVTTYALCPTCGKELHPETELCPSCSTVLHHDEISHVAQDEAAQTHIQTEEDESHLKAREEKNIKVRKEKEAKSRIGVAKMIILVTGIILLISNTLLMAFLFATKTAITSMQNNSPSQRQEQGQRQREPQYRGFGERDYSNRGQENEGRRNLPFVMPKLNIKGNLFKLLLLVVIIGLVQGIFFMFLYKYIDKKPFIAVLIAFVFEITYDILKIVVRFVQMLSSFGNEASFKHITKEVYVIFSSIQTLQLVAVSGIFIYFFYKALQSSVALRKMGGK